MEPKTSIMLKRQMNINDIRKPAKRIFIVLCLLLFLFGLASSVYLVSILIYSLPLLLSFQKNKSLKIYSVWLTVFLMIQSVFPFSLFNSDFVTLSKNFQREINVEGIQDIAKSQLVTTDAMGFRTMEKINYLEKHDNQYRIFTIGGSTTAQMYLSDDHTWSSILHKRLNERFRMNCQVINTGVSGLRAKHHLQTLKKINKYHPDMIVIHLGINDWNYHIKSTLDDKRTFSFKTYALKQSPVGRLFKKVVKRAAFWVKSKNEKTELFVYVPKKKEGSKGRKDIRFFPTSVLSDYARTLNEITDLCNEFNVECVFVNQPSGYSADAEEDLKARLWMTPPFSDYSLDFESLMHISKLYNDFLLDYGKRKNVHVLDLARLIPPSGKYMYDDCHYTLHGTKKVANEIFNYISPIISRKRASNRKGTTLEEAPSTSSANKI